MREKTKMSLLMEHGEDTAGGQEGTDEARSRSVGINTRRHARAHTHTHTHTHTQVGRSSRVHPPLRGANWNRDSMIMTPLVAGSVTFAFQQAVCVCERVGVRERESQCMRVRLCVRV